MTGLLIAFEGLDQSGKQTQAEGVKAHLVARGRECHLLSFPDYATPIGSEISKALHGEREYGPDVMQLMYVANRYEKRIDMERALEAGLVLVCDRYLASSIAYGEAQGLDASWLRDMQRYLPGPDLTILLDIAPETAVSGRPRVAIATSGIWHCCRESVRATSARRHTVAGSSLNGERPRDAVSADVVSAVEKLLEPR